MPDKASFGTPRKRQTAYVVFQESAPGGHRLLHKWMTSPGFRHCWLMLPVYYPEPGLMAEVFTMKIESLFWGVDTQVWWQSPDIVSGAFIEAGVTTIIEFPFTTPAKKPNMLWHGPLTCVSLTKAILLIDDWKTLTPRQLFVYLVRHGGKECHS